GTGPQELLKIADFGISRPVGLNTTFGNMEIGTPGYAAPEQLFRSGGRTSTASDVFSLGALVFVMLAGEDLFVELDPLKYLAESQLPRRRNLAEAQALDPDLRARPEVCRQLDQLIARATAPRPEHRFQRATELSAAVVPLLRGPRWAAPRSTASPPTLRTHQAGTAALAGWSWQLKHRLGDDRVVLSLGWQSGGQTLARTSYGFEYWNGTTWAQAVAPGVDVGEVRFLRSIQPGTWIIGGTGVLLAYESQGGVPTILTLPAKPKLYLDADGDPEDLAVFLAQEASGQASLEVLCGGRWLKTLLVQMGATVSGLCRLADERWLVVGRTAKGLGAVWLHEPLQWQLHELSVPPARAFVACAAHQEYELGVVVGSHGASLFIQQGEVTTCQPTGDTDLSAVALASDGSAWAASRGALWLRLPGSPEWQCAWRDPSWTLPIVGLYAESSIVVAVTVDGGVLEGRRSDLEPRGASDEDSPRMTKRSGSWTPR
ncbi:serine/threonine protein kinase, partial [Myxococcota bacterium]